MSAVPVYQVTQPSLSPRDMASMADLKALGLVLVEIRISEFSLALGKRLASLPLPIHTQVLCVQRSRATLFDLEYLFFKEGDLVFVMTDDEDAVRRIFTGYTLLGGD